MVPLEKNYDINRNTNDTILHIILHSSNITLPVLIPTFIGCIYIC